jgi:hypothetical protein
MESIDAEFLTLRTIYAYNPRTNTKINSNYVLAMTPTGEAKWIHPYSNLSNTGFPKNGGRPITSNIKPLFFDTSNNNIAYYNTYGDVIPTNYTNSNSLGSNGYSWSNGYITNILTSNVIFNSTSGKIVLSSKVTNNNINIGSNNGLLNTNNNSIAIGNQAGGTPTSGLQQGASAIGIGLLATGQGDNSVAIGVIANALEYGVSIGYQAGTSPTYVPFTSGQNVAIGYQAGNTNQGFQAVAIGTGAGNINQGNYTISIGAFQPGNTNQNEGAISIGYYGGAGQNDQGSNAISIGRNAGLFNQGSNSVAIGRDAGQLQGTNSVAIGYQAGLFQGKNSIAINASGTGLTAAADSCFIKPIKGSNAGFGAGRLGYNTTTGEVFYSTT